MTTRTLVDQAQRDLIAGETVAGRDGLTETLFVEAGAGSGKTTALVSRVVALVRSGVPMTRIAAITFTEKAAAELRHRVRDAFDELLEDRDLGPSTRADVVAARDDLDVAAVGTLHAFARRLLAEHAIDAGLPPNVEVLDPVASEIAFEQRWARDRLALLDDPAMSRTLLLADALGLPVHAGPGRTTMRPLVRAFNDNWDRLLDERAVPWTVHEPPSLDMAVVRIGEVVGDVLHMARTCDDQDDTLCTAIRAEVGPWFEALRDAPDESERLRVLIGDKPTFKYGNRGRGTSWVEVSKETMAGRVRDLIDLRAAVVAEVTEAVLHQLAARTRQIVLDAVAERRATGRLEFHDLLVLARQMLEGPAGRVIRRSLRDRYTHLLLDEFQDTDPIQLRLAMLIATDPDGDGDDGPDDGRLFFVGDPKQSIYRFRRADIGMYLDAAQAHSGEGGPLELVTNFRSAPTVLAWVNAVFGRLIEHQDGAQPAYVPLRPRPDAEDPPVGPGVTLLGVDPLADERAVTASVMREHEARQVADAVVAAIEDGWQVRDGSDDQGRDTWRPCRPSDIAILLPARTSLSMLEQALEERRVAYRADASSLVYSTREVRDLMMTVRALVDPADGLALVSALRSTVFGCGDDDLASWRGAGGRFDLTWPGGERAPNEHPVGEALAYLDQVRLTLPHTSPAELLSRIVTDRRLFELGYLHRRPRDVWRRLRFVIDQARLWSDTTAGTLAEYVAWARMQASDSVRVAESVLPETDDQSVRIMTVHAAKGLEFPITVLSGMTTRMRRTPTGIQVSWPDGEPIGLKVRKGVSTEQYETYLPIDEQLDHEERLRLLYVAATRARDHLVVSVVRKGEPRSSPSSAEAIAGACLGAGDVVQVAHEPHGRVLSGAEPSPPPEDFDRQAWAATRQGLVTTASRRGTWSATEVQYRLAASAADDDLLAGDDKHQRDLELPSSRKGRYGTAVGRAVHAVLQTVDLATGAGIDETAAAQAAAEGVVGREGEIASLARAALTAPSVREAVTCARWRETYVAATIGGTTVEGYLDLLYRRPDGRLVVVDYKTASSLSDLDRRVAHYRPQGATYALAVTRAAGLDVAEVVFVFLMGDRAEERRISDLEDAVDEVATFLGTAAA